MKYVGSKNRLSKELAPIIQSYITDKTKGYFEPFVGGANMIDKINHNNKIGFDVHEELIELLKHVQNLDNELPQHISEEHYNEVKYNRDNYPKWYQGLVGFTASFSARYFNTYARSFKSDGVTRRDMSNEAIRNIEKQREKLVGIKFDCMSFLDVDISKINGYVIYCDPPYRGKEKYYEKNKTGFPYKEFDEWCRELSKNNIVLISEYNMPDDFECVWQKDYKVGNSPNHKTHGTRTEKLFLIK